MPMLPYTAWCFGLTAPFRGQQMVPRLKLFLARVRMLRKRIGIR